jgi:sulfonate transport system substrate-binding protein
MGALKVVAAALVAAGFALSSGQVGAEPLKIRMPYVVPVNNWGSILYEKKDVMQHYGKSYEVEVSHFQGTTPMITALGANELDVADLAYSSFSLAIENAGMTDLRVIADESQTGANGYDPGGYYVLKDGPIKTVADMKGKVAASVGAGTAVDIAMRAMLAKSGLQEKRDYTMVEAGFASMNAMLMEKKVDLVTSVRPFSTDPTFREKTKLLFTNVDALDGSAQFIVFVAKDAWLKKNKAAVVDWMEDAIRAIHWYQDPKNRDAALEIFTRVSKQPKSMFEYKYTKEDSYQDPNLMPNVESLQRVIDIQQKIGFLKSKLDVSKYTDLSYVKEAGARVNGK